MAKAKSTAARRKPIISDETEMELWNVLRRIETVECTAACVERSLLESKSEHLTEIAICVEQNIANELGRITRDAAAIYAELCGEPYRPLLQSPILGLRVRPASDKVAREGD